MKHIRKIVALLIGVVFFAAIVISIGMIFAVKNINVTMLTYSDDCTESYIDAKSSLKSIKGQSILFVRSADLSDALGDSNYALESYEKKYPCTINVVLKERLELFAVSVGGQYSMYDSDGKFLRKDIENRNINDNSPNVELTGIAVEEVEDVAKVAMMFKKKFNSLRSVVTSINVDNNPLIENYTAKIIFNLRCGLKIELDNYTEYTDEKLDTAYLKFCTLTDRQKLSGTLRSYNLADGEVNAVYSNR